MLKNRPMAWIAAAVLGATPAFAEVAAEPSVYDKIWGAPELVDNKDAKVLQNLAIVGRLQGDAYSFQSEDSSYEDIEWRRFRLGGKAEFLDNFVLHSEMDLDMNEADSGSWDDFYIRLTDTYLGWDPSDAVGIKLGKQSVGFTLDGATSSKKLIVPERSIVAENLWFPTEYFTGATATGKQGAWSYDVGAFSASDEAEFGHFESGYFALFSVGHKIGKKGELRIDYVYNDPDYTGKLKDSDYTVGTRNLEHIGALVYKQMLTEKLGLWADLAGGVGISEKSNNINQGDLLGVDIMPFYNISEQFQLVLQYAGVTSLDDRSDVSMSRYAYRNAGRDKVETAHNLLLGFNWYLYGHKLKWQNAVEYNHGANLAQAQDDYNGYGLTSALRLSW